ncbi:GTP-binding protein [Pyrodictium delaneyi]|uniref:GTPase HflX n=1 Tax=Pyrodictium delaneyi TaxID=1273541 RepID=A0A0P0N4T3_9CREN|nr:GTPase HflX [Pyrodictium delaneyi]ALL01267.1 GTP-binding protein [Pyrodictium delaneyi]
MKRALLALPRRLTSWEEREAYALLETAGYTVVDVVRYRPISRSRLFSKAKLEELAEKAKPLRGDEEARIIVYDELRPREYFRIVREARVDAIDRTLLILEIFALHAGSREAKLQIELARLKHQLPVIKEAIRLAKMRELPGFLGPGGYAVDAYYRYMVSRIARIRRELQELRRRREIERAKRRSAGLPHVAIVGYASAGKTTLFNKISGEKKPVGPEYFTTISPKVKATSFDGLRFAVVDTVGFISRIPPEIIEAFHSTLEEAAYADLILYVLDVSEDEYVMTEKLSEGLDTLRRIGVVDRPMIIAANKVDLVRDRSDLERVLNLIEAMAESVYPGLQGVIPVSAATSEGLGRLLCRVATLLRGTAGSMC